MKRKIAIFTTHPIQYQIPLFRALEKKKNIDLTIFYASNHGIKPKVDTEFNKKFAWNINLVSGYKYKIIGSKKNNVNSFFLNSNKIKKELIDSGFDATIIFGWNSIYYLKSIIYSLFYSKILILRIENNLLKKENNYKKFIKTVFLFLFFKFFNYFLYIGKQNYKFYRRNGIKKEKLLPDPYFVDNDFFKKKNKRNKIKKKNETVFIFSGKFIERKRPMDILKALNSPILKKYKYKFIFVGEGKLKKRCIQFCKKNNLTNVSFVGFVNQKQISKYYNLSDVIVMPSEYETWGLSINEAMASGCACIVSNETGCARDLVRTNGKNKNGLTFNCGDIQSLSLKIEYFLKNKKKIYKFKKNSINIIKRYTLNKTVNSINKIVK